MTKIVVHGKALDPLGLAQQLSLRQGRNAPELERRSWACRPEELRSRTKGKDGLVDPTRDFRSSALAERRTGPVT